jgi:hypothetical protein
MYKKITHTITEEEHFDLPADTEIKRMLDNGNNGNNGYNGYDDMRPMVGATTADKFRADVNAYFTTMHQRLTSFATATENGDMDALLTEETAYFDEVNDLGLMLRPYYGIEFNERLTQVFRGVGLGMVGICRNLKFKIDVKNQITNLDSNFDGFDLLLNQYNNNWFPGSGKRMWVAIRESLVGEVTAIINQDDTTSASAHTQAAERISTFANSFANSVIQQYPNKFIQ